MPSCLLTTQAKTTPDNCTFYMPGFCCVVGAVGNHMTVCYWADVLIVTSGLFNVATSSSITDIFSKSLLVFSIY